MFKVSGKPQPGFVQVFYGDGRGKTSAAMGEIVRAVSAGLRVTVVFFMKGERRNAEYSSLKALGVEYAVFGRSGFLSGADAREEDARLCRQALEFAEGQISSGKWDLVVLDEINNARYYGFIETEDILRLLSVKPACTSLVLTGKTADKEVAEKADLVAEFRKLKHPYDRGILARAGIDY
ncbi:MAG: cob(I)yrinic acid a,c-diamide adenosyltransferase [Dehalococcoides mccartyi]|uniref:Cob(I)yrinic acid a,c-diamide adenosyltransferase n=1 Tax=bioreactor metagenome TaxID=1076179 RepID=A0A644UEY6_9ZZZZ|nr:MULTISPECIES: cob(I)yrinic acid a,c-diamide adenosyltransferase [Dehalococcoides]AQU02695.1 cob(I)alamin adenolsyltransferase [Dehalococcoides mccartyi]AQU04030.1 cob(I)alamin adenolsyltransferase [Dehalococcoides mccartyi]MDP4279487.1 cob(I)yrinic acid a,c-diamide adenosyltransferase [Dehalococcoides mccartyi]MEA4878558.1 cob(I)yrinic acid a,c-diamide adenosyltransferase [Dehalococcoides mccartyi]